MVPQSVLDDVFNTRKKLWDIAALRPVAVETRGKAPKPGMNWPARAQQNPPEATVVPPDPDALNTGVAGAGNRLADGDIPDPARAKRAEEIIEYYFGPAPTRWRDNAPNFLMVYRAAAGSPGKRILVGVHGKIELLGDGQQGVLFGYHPSGAKLRWRGAKFTDIIAITEADVDALFADQELRDLLGVDVSSSASSAGSNGAAHVPNDDPHMDIFDVRALLAELDNDGPANWDEWKITGMAVWAATDGSDEGFEEFDRWSQKNADVYDAAETEKCWDQITRSPPDRIGGGTLRHKLKTQRDAKAKQGNGHSNGNGAAAPGTTLKYLHGNENDTAPLEQTTVVAGIAYKGSATLVHGKPKSGKTFLVLDLALAVSGCYPGVTTWLGQEIIETGPTLYVACEGHGGWWKRTRQVPNKPDTFVGWAARRMFLIESHDKGRTYVPHPDEVLEAVLAVKTRLGVLPVMVIIDTVFRSFNYANVNQSDHMSAYNEAVTSVAALGIAVVLIHHSAKGTGKPAGSVALEAGCDTIINVEKVKPDDPMDTIRRWQVEEAKDDPPTAWRLFDLETVNVGTDNFGRAATTCKVVDQGLQPVTAGKPGRPVNVKEDDFVLGVLHELINEEGVEDCTGAPEGILAVPEARWRDEVYKRSRPGDPQDTKRHAFNRCRDRLINSGAVVSGPDADVWVIEMPASV